MSHVVTARHLAGLVRGAVVDDDDLDLVDALDLVGQVLEHRRQGLRLVEAGYLDEEAHGWRAYHGSTLALPAAAH